MAKKKPTAPKLSVVRSFNAAAIDHRTTFTHCPNCDAEFDDKRWDKEAVTLVLETVYGKHGSLAVVSECPSCHEKSWVHHEFWAFQRDYGNEWPEDWKKAAQEEYTRRHLAAVHRFADSQCARCAYLVEVEQLKTLPIINCTFGKPVQILSDGRPFYHHCFSERNCQAFKERPVSKDPHEHSDSP